MWCLATRDRYPYFRIWLTVDAGEVFFLLSFLVPRVLQNIIFFCRLRHRHNNFEMVLLALQTYAYPVEFAWQSKCIARISVCWRVYLRTSERWLCHWDFRVTLRVQSHFLYLTVGHTKRDTISVSRLAQAIIWHAGFITNENYNWVAYPGVI